MFKSIKQKKKALYINVAIFSFYVIGVKFKDKIR